MNKKAKLKAGLSFGAFMAIFFILKELFSVEELTIKQLLAIFVSACLGGAVAGFLFAWLTGLFASSSFVSKSTRVSLETDETLLFETPANHFKGIEAVGGRLYLTNKRLLFKSHQLNIQNHQLAIALTDIQHTNRYKTVGLLNNGLSVTTCTGKTEKFVVEQVEEWTKLLTHRSG